MTLTKTIRRRNQRTRRRERLAREALHPPIKFQSVEWMTREGTALLADKLKTADLFSRRY